MTSHYRSKPCGCRCTWLEGPCRPRPTAKFSELFFEPSVFSEQATATLLRIPHRVGPHAIFTSVLKHLGLDPDGLVWDRVLTGVGWRPLLVGWRPPLDAQDMEMERLGQCDSPKVCLACPKAVDHSLRSLVLGFTLTTTCEKTHGKHNMYIPINLQS